MVWILDKMKNAGKKQRDFIGKTIAGDKYQPPQPTAQPPAMPTPTAPQQTQTQNSAFAPNGISAPPVGKKTQSGYTPTTAPYGMDQTNPGVQEQFWQQNQNKWTDSAFQGPGQGEQFWNQVQGGFNKANQDLTPQFNKFYDNARDSAVGEANKQAGARGVYGSSQALNNVGNVISDVEGQRAKTSTDFMFNNAANQRANLGQYGDMAFGAQNADQSRRGFDIGALGSAYGASGAAQGQRDNRIQQQFGNTAQMAGMYLPFLQGNYDQMLGNDQALVTGSAQAGPAATAAALAQQNQNRQQNSQDISNGLGVAGMLGGFGGGGGQSRPQYPGYPNYNPGQYGGPGGAF